MANTLFHRLLRYDLEYSRRAPIDWDIRDPPPSARYHPLLLSPTVLLSPEDLAMPATSPPVIAFTIICDVLPYNTPIVARNFAGVTIHDVLSAIHNALQDEITRQEWDNFTKKQQDRIQIFRDDRLRRFEDPSDADKGIKAIDTLLRHSFFGGLTPIPGAEPACVLTLRRVQE